MSLLSDTLVLLILGCCGWILLSFFRVPMAPLLGPFVLLGALRVMEVSLPPLPPFLFPLIQISIGAYIGSQIKKKELIQVKSMGLAALIIALWSLSVVFVLGSVLARFTPLDQKTAMLAHMIGGLPEMSMLSMATGADTTVTVSIFTLRMLVTIMVFPPLFRYFASKEPAGPVPLAAGKEIATNPWPKRRVHLDSMKVLSGLKKLKDKADKGTLYTLIRTGAIAGGGGIALYLLKVPAGLMVGAMLFSIAASLLGMEMTKFTPRLFSFLMMGVGIVISDTFTRESIDVLTSGNMAASFVLSTLLILSSSFLIASLLHRLYKWDYPTCFLISAPAGLTVMTTLAIKYDRDPVSVSMLHLTRIIVLKTLVPFLFIPYM